ncbi:MAG: Na/Pi cotransporter family protein [Bacillota bacterium]|nr:Na/Pi cotransporter family protein [Bacillota bacterium]
MDFLNILLMLLGGAGLFLYGMNIMSAGLEKIAGKRLEGLIAKLSGRVFHGIAVGVVVTAIIQSSSATTVMVVGFVNAGIMTLKQAIGIIMGANIGTTVTAQLVTINITAIAPLGIALGVALKLFSKKNRTEIIGETILGFSLIFFGMKVMTTAIAPVKNIPEITEFFALVGAGGFKNTVLGFFLGAGFTALLQSSSATTGIMIAMASTGILPFEAAFPILMGTNVGTCVTAIISSIGANNTAKRAAMMHLLFNVIGTVVFLTLFSGISISIVKMISDDPTNQLANAHTLFNVVNTVLLYPFSMLIVKASTWIIPITKEEVEEVKLQRALHLDERMLSTPQIAMSQVYKEVFYMADVVKTSLMYAIEGLMNNDDAAYKKTFKLEKNINEMERRLVDYLIKLTNTGINTRDRSNIDVLFNTINDLERVGDHAENIAELAEQKFGESLSFSDEANKEMQGMITAVSECFDYSIEAIRKKDHEAAKMCVEMEGVVDEMEKTLRKQHIVRLNQGVCESNGGIIFLDTLSNLERVSDHASNIAITVLDGYTD